MSDDAPNHLTEAWCGGTMTDFLAALRPEDAHLVPEWQTDLLAVEGRLRKIDRASAEMVEKLVRERDEARAEIERLKTKLARRGEASNGV